MKYGLQIYTVRDELTQDFEGTLRTIKDMGYNTIELYSLFDRKPKELKSLLDEIGLSVGSIMFPYHDFSCKQDAIVETAKAFDIDFVVCPGIAEEHRTYDGYAGVAKVLESSAAKMATFGITVCYHNHAFEFEKFSDGSCGYDMLMNQTECLCFEPDVYWFTFASRDLLKMMEKLAGRIPLLHLKDMSAGNDRNYCEVGQGVLPMKEIIELAKNLSVEYAFVEQDENWACNDSLNSVRQSLHFLSRLHK